MIALYIALAGALGALARWAFSRLMLAIWGPGFPLGTLGENLSGCFLLGLLMELAERGVLISSELRTVLAVGFIGTFTTFSTFEFETLRLARRGGLLLAGANFALNIVLGFALLSLGAHLGGWLLRLRRH